MNFVDTALWIYAYTVASSLSAAILVISIIAFVALLIVCLVYAINEEEKPPILNYWRSILLAYFLVITFSAMVPSVDQLKLIFGGASVIAAGSAVVNAEGAEKIPQNVMNAVNYFLEQVGKEEPKEEAKK